jgi:chemotaxis protein MotB
MRKGVATMSRKSAMAAGILGWAIFGLVGCADNRDAQITALQERASTLEREHEDLNSRLAQAQQEADNSSSRALQLQQMLDELRRQSGEQPISEDGRWTIVGDYAWTTIKEEILFDPGKNTLKTGGKTTLKTVAGELKQKFNDRNIWVIGHTDSDPIRRSADQWKDNWDLSQGRARSVAAELISSGLEPRNVMPGGQGEFNPKSPNDSKANKMQNRRVTIVAVNRPVQVR